MPSDPAAPPDEPDLGAVVDAMAPVLRLTLAPEWRAAVVTNLATIAAAARLVDEVALADEVEPAPVFRA